MTRKAIFFIAMLFVASLFRMPEASAQSSYYTSQGCSGCHGSTATCNGCHKHGAHNSGGAVNVSGTTNKTSYAPGETVTVTINGGYKTGWIRAILYDQNMTELARSTGPSGTGGGAGYPITLTAPAPSAAGTYTWSVSWYGNYMYNPGTFQQTCSSTRTTNCWKVSSNPNHGEEIVAMSSFTVASAAAPAISVTDSVAPATDLTVPFGSVNTGASASQTVTVTNTGNADLLVGAVGSTNALAAPFSITNNTCSNQTIKPSAACTFTIAFAPTATGTFTDSVNIPSNDAAKPSVTVNVSGTGAVAPTPAISVTDSIAPTTDLSVPFGSVNSGASASQTVTVTNSGTANLVLGAVASSNPLAAPFSISNDTCSSKTLTPSASCTLTVAFAPAAAGTFSDSFSIPSNDPTKATVTMNVSGTGAVAPTPAISVTDSVAPAADLTVPFGSVNTGASASQTVTVTNTGTADLLVGAVGSTNALAAPFSITNNTCSNQTIKPSAACTLTIAFAPTATGTFTDSFTVPSNDTAKPSVTVNVSGTGAAVPTPAISVTDSVAPATDLSVPFGSIVAGSSASQTVTVTNTGTANLVLGAVASTNPLAAPFSVTSDSCSNQTLTPAASCTIALGFAPTATGSASDSFSIPSNDPAKSSVTVNVSGTGSAVPAPVISVTDSVLPANDLLVPFGNVTAGGSASQTVTITNSGNAALVIGAVGSSDPVAAPFSLSSDGCSNQTIAPSASCTITVAFAPTVTGTFTDGFSIPSNDAAKPSVTVSVSGTGAAAAVGRIKVTDSVLPVDDLQIAYGDVRKGRTVNQSVTIANTASGDLVIGTIASANPLAAPFSIASDSCSGKTLSGGSTCTVTVSFTPTATGTFNDSFDIPSSDPDTPTVAMQVSGSGAASKGNNPPGKPKPKYPADHEENLGTSLDMSWTSVTDPDGDPVTYELHIATDSTFSSPAITAKTGGRAGRLSGTLFAGTGLGFIFLGFVFAGAARGRKGLLLIAALAVFAGSSIVGCSSGSTTTTPLTGAAVTQHVAGLKTSTTYYWKVVASDGNGGVTESNVSTFTTK